MSRPGLKRIPWAAVAVVLAMLLAGCAATPEAAESTVGPAMPRLEAGVLEMSDGEGFALHLEQPGWAWVRLESSTTASYWVHSARVVNGTLEDMMQPPAMGPNEYLSVSVFVPGEDGALLPVSDMILWGFAEELRAHESGADKVGFWNLDSAQLGGGAHAVAIIATNMEDMALVVVANEEAGPEHERVLPTVPHPRLMTTYVADGEASTVASQDLFSVEERVDFPDQTVSGRGWDMALAWQATYGGAGYGSVTEEVGHRDAMGACSGEGFQGRPYVDPADPTGKRPAVHLGAAKRWYGERSERPVCAAVAATVVGEWERVDSGAWFLHVPLDPPPLEPNRPR